jgi:hypothetical protein
MSEITKDRIAKIDLSPFSFSKTEMKAFTKRIVIPRSAAKVSAAVAELVLRIGGSAFLDSRKADPFDRNPLTISQRRLLGGRRDDSVWRG